MPVRLKNLIRALDSKGIAWDPKGGKGSHGKFRQNGKSYPVPASRGEKTELDDCYIRGVCRAFGLDEAEVRQLL